MSYPEHAKIQAVDESERNTIGAFLEWIYETFDLDEIADTQSVFVRFDDERERVPWPEYMISRYYGVDIQKFYDEKTQMLKEIRENNERLDALKQAEQMQAKLDQAKFKAPS